MLRAFWSSITAAPFEPNLRVGEVNVYACAAPAPEKAKANATKPKTTFEDLDLRLLDIFLLNYCDTK
jgi:hypothetical protein